MILHSAPAQAARVHKLEVSEALPNGANGVKPAGVAVNQVSHHFYVGTFDNDPHVYNFDADGEPDPVHPELTGAPFTLPGNEGAGAKLRGIAVDNSGGAHAGYIYVVISESFFKPGHVQQFNPEGEATAVTITGSAVPPDGTAQPGGLPPVVNKGSFAPFVVAVDGSGNLFVTDSSARAIDVFTPAGVFVRQIASSLSIDPEGIAIEGPDIYVALQGRTGPAESPGPGLTELDASTGKCVQVGCAPIDPARIHGVAVDNATGIIYTTGSNAESGEKEGKFSEYEASTGQLLGVTHPSALLKPTGIGVDEASGRVIVADENAGTLDIFGPLETVPDVETLAPEDVTDRAATLKGEIGAAEVAGATCVFQYVDDAAFKAHGFEGAAETPCEEAGHSAGPYSGSEMHEVEANVSGLGGGTTYHERILGTNANGSNPGVDVPFQTKGPSVSGTEATEVGVGEATLKTKVDPNGADTTYRFQYLTQAQFEASGWAGAIEAPAGGEDLGAGTGAIARAERIEGLSPRTEYRFRVLAISSGGESEGETQGEEVTFSTFAPPTTGLPDGRRYEQASPVNKNGSNVQGMIDLVQASRNGDRITFASLAGIPGGDGAQSFPTFLASRAADSSGWSTQGLLPPASYGPRGVVIGWNEDLEDTYDYASRPSEEGGKLLRRHSSDGSLTEAGALGGFAGVSPFAYAGSSSAGAVALLETVQGGLLPEDLQGKQNLYAYDRETNALVLAGVMNDGSVPPGGAMAGPYDWFKSRSLTIKGGVLHDYYTQQTHALSADGSKVFFTAGGTGQLYVRINPLAPQSAMAGEECSEPAKACTVRVSAPADGVSDPGTPAAFLGASADGRLVYFFDKGKLTADSTAGAGADLYRYDVQTGSLIDLTPDSAEKQGARVEGMLAIGGPTGEDAYFVAAGALAVNATQASARQTNLYSLHGSAIAFIARLSTGEQQGDYLDWTPTSEGPGGGRVAHGARLSSDGQTLLFTSSRKLTPYDSRGVAELYLYRSGQGISCLSCNPSGEAPAGPAGVQQIPDLTFSIGRTNSIQTRNLSLDGRRVFFDSADRLVAADRNDVNDVYEWEAPDPTNPTDSCTAESSAYVSAAGGCLFLISGGAEGAGASWFGDADQKGENAFFFTAQQLVAQDRDELVDVYDARVGGGIAAQEEEPPARCEGEAGCRGAAPSPPSPPSPGSTSFTGPGNPKPPKPCPKGKVRKGGRCVKPKHRHHKKHKHAKRHGREKGGRR
jgi:DNA-binding beta-propeller fold protein YncE